MSRGGKNSAFLEVIKHYGIDERQCNQQVSDAHLEKISRSGCKQWKSLPPYLELDTIVAEDIDKGPANERSKRHDFLLKWKDMKGFSATYKQLITALLKIKCRQDAEKLCEMLKKYISQTPSLPSSPSSATAGTNIPSTEQGACAITSLDEDTLRDLKLQLKSELRAIVTKYSRYVSCIRKALSAKGVSPQDLVSDLLTMPATSESEQDLTLLSAHRTELEKATTLNEIFNCLTTECASFLDYDIFKFVVETYELNQGQEKLKYDHHLKAYIHKHNISEFFKINPLLKKLSASSTELLLKFDIEPTSKLAKIIDLKSSIAEVLGLRSATLQLLDIKEGCVAVTFSIPTPVAETVFNKDTLLTVRQVADIQALAILQLDCNGRTFDFRGKTTSDMKSETPNTSSNARKQYYFIQEPDDDLKCVICSYVAEDPLQHECGKLFCKKCLEKRGKERPCPQCKTEGGMFFPDRRGERDIQKLGVKCSYVERGCEWKGTVGTLNEHVTSCIYRRKESTFTRKGSESDTECYVFLDHSNLWVAGQKATAKKLVDADSDSRFRVDLGRFLQLLTKDRAISKACLYGSIPPLIDTVWKAAREKKFIVYIFKRSVGGRVKEIHGAMARDMMKTLHTKNKANATFIVVTGDRNLKPVIDDILESSVHVELWSWEDAMAREFRQLANTHNLFTANCLDSVVKHFSFTAYMSQRDKNDVDPAHAIVYKGVPADDHFKFMLADHMHRLLRLFYITSLESQSEGKKDYIIEFPKTTPEVILEEIRRFSRFEYQPCSYPEYTMGFKQFYQPVPITNRFTFEPLIDSDYESLPDSEMMSVMEGMEKMASPFQSIEYETEATGDFDGWDTEVRRKPGKMTHAKKKKENPCSFGDHCPETIECPFLHTEEEMKLFARFPKIKFQYYKSRICNKKEEHITEGQRKNCPFAHISDDSWCLDCRMYGHLTNNCQVNK